jgi:hypothetical protein
LGKHPNKQSCLQPKTTNPTLTLATLEISRAKRWVHPLRNYLVILDSQQPFYLSNGQNVSINLSPGTYRMKVKMGWMQSELFTIGLKKNETQYLEVGPTIRMTPLQQALNMISLVGLFGGLSYWGTITLSMGIGLLLLWFVRDVVLTKGKSLLYYLFKGHSFYLYIKPLRHPVRE